MFTDLSGPDNGGCDHSLLTMIGVFVAIGFLSLTVVAFLLVK